MCSFGLVLQFALQRHRGLPQSRAGLAFSLGITGLAPATTFSSSVPAKTIRHSTPAFLRAVSYNRNRSTPKARSRFRDDDCAANARLSALPRRVTGPCRDGFFDARKLSPQAANQFYCVQLRTARQRPRLESGNPYKFLNQGNFPREIFWKKSGALPDKERSFFLYGTGDA